MATINQRFPHIPAGEGTTYNIIGERITFKIAGAETGGAFSVMELTSPPGGGPPLHTHRAAERFIVQDGAFEFSGLEQGDPYAIQAMPGDVVYIPGGAPHTYKTISPTAARALGILAPGEEMESFFAEAGIPEAAPSAPPTQVGRPSDEEIARHVAIAGRHGISFVLPGQMPTVATGNAEVLRG
jgi:quercetin dioxygenase-like cupin family protein